MFKIKHNDDGRNGYHITFNNGWTLSIQWHDGSYCSKGGKTAEVAVFDPNNEMDYNPDWGDQVLGYQDEKQVLDWMLTTSARSPDSVAREWPAIRD